MIKRLNVNIVINVRENNY